MNKYIEDILIITLTIVLIITIATIFIFLCFHVNDAYYQISAEQCSDANGTYTMEQGCISSNGSRILNTVNLSNSRS